MTTRSSKKWIVRDVEGKIFGPFTTEQVGEQIDRNYFLGDEQIASYPGGDWKPLSRAAEFSDRLLDVLAAEVQSSSDKKSRARGGIEKPRTSGFDITESESGEPASAPPPAPRVEETAPAFDEESDSIHALKNKSEKRSSTSSRPGKPDDIELKNLKELRRFSQIKENRLPIMVMIAGAVVAATAFWWTGDKSNTGNKIRLLAPRPAVTAIELSKRTERFKHALISFQKDTFDNYQAAENELVEIVEGSVDGPAIEKQKSEYLAYLCLTYRELWPFAFQDDKDLRTIAQVTQEAKRLDAGGMNGSICEIVQLLVAGKYSDAQGLTDSVIQEKSQAPVLFELRGDQYLNSRDFISAANYFSQARSLWPGWQKSYVQEARANAESGKFPQAMQLYQGVLARVRDHGVAKIELGLLEALQFNQLDKGLGLITSGVGETVPRLIGARGYLGIAKIYLEKKQSARALVAAKKSYALNAANKETKELIVMLGGAGAEKELKPGEADLMFLGDQYMRSGDYFAAQAQFKAAFEENPKNGMAAMKTGQSLWQLHQTAEAIEWMQKATRVDPHLVSAYVELADYFAQRFDYMAAAQMLKLAQAEQPNNFEVYRGFASVELRRNNFSGAVGFGERALKLYGTDLQTLLILAKASAGIQKYQDAQTYAARALELDYNDTEAQSVYAKVEAGLHGVDAGATYLLQLINKYVITRGQQIPQAAIEYRTTLGEIYMQDERYQAADEIFRQALSLDANNKRALIGLGKAQQAESLIAQALESYLKAAVLDPADADPIFFSGRLYYDIGKNKEATLQFKRVISINPRYPEAHTALAKVAVRSGDFQTAIDEANQEHSINPDLSEAYVVAAEAYFGLKQYSNCAGEYQKAVTKRGGGASLFVKMARCYRLAGAIDSAQSLLKQATAAENGNPDIYKEQGALFHTKGMADEAIGAYDTYLRLAPNAPDRAEVEESIRKIQSGNMSIGN